MISDIVRAKKVIVGWYHSHLGAGLFFSQQDRETQILWQKTWKQAVGIVVDPTLVSEKNHGIDVFRLDKNLAYFEEVTLGFTATFRPMRPSCLESYIHVRKQ